MAQGVFRFGHGNFRQLGLDFFHRPQIIGVWELGQFGVFVKRQTGPW